MAAGFYKNCKAAGRKYCRTKAAAVLFWCMISPGPGPGAQ
jgi:hypothetical protein